jgi:two-component system, cell cycle response regulator DivK
MPVDVSPHGPRASRGPNSKPSPGAASPRDTRASLKVLVVDDVDDTREMYERYFQFQGFSVATAADGVAALLAVPCERPDVIVLDLAMPRLTGWDVIRNLKAHALTQHIPIIALSGQQARESALREGADSYLEKPCVPEVLLREVLRVLGEPGTRDDP